MSLQQQLQAINNKLEEVDNLEKSLQLSKTEMRNEKVDLLRKLYPNIWIVRATPNDINSSGAHHVAHDTAWYTSEEQARTYARSGYHSDGVYWLQSVYSKDSLDVRGYILLDKLIT